MQAGMHTRSVTNQASRFVSCQDWLPGERTAHKSLRHFVCLREAEGGLPHTASLWPSGAEAGLPASAVTLLSHSTSPPVLPLRPEGHGPACQPHPLVALAPT